MLLNLPKVPGMEEGGQAEGEEGAKQMILTARFASEKDPKQKRKKSIQVLPPPPNPFSLDF